MNRNVTSNGFSLDFSLHSFAVSLARHLLLFPAFVFLTFSAILRSNALLRPNHFTYLRIESLWNFRIQCHMHFMYLWIRHCVVVYALYMFEYITNCSVRWYSVSIFSRDNGNEKKHLKRNNVKGYSD